jgi:UDP:flavonoid glycosyltransferase YjiC (YdhE family)
VPVYFDQFANVQTAVKKGYALQLDIRDFDEKVLEDSIRKIIEDQRFLKKPSMQLPET